MVTTDFFQGTSPKTYMVKVYLILYESVDGEVIMAFFKLEEYIASRMVSLKLKGCKYTCKRQVHPVLNSRYLKQ